MNRLVLFLGAATTLIAMTMADTFPLYKPVKVKIESEEEKYLNPVSYLGIKKEIEGVVNIKRIQNANKPHIIIQKNEDSDESNRKYAVVEIDNKDSSQRESDEKREERRREDDDEWKKRKESKEEDRDEKYNDNEHEEEKIEEHQEKREEEKEKDKHKEEEYTDSESEHGKYDEREKEKYNEGLYQQDNRYKNIGINTNVAHINIAVQERGTNREKIIVEQTDERNIKVKVVDPEDVSNTRDIAEINVSVIKE